MNLTLRVLLVLGALVAFAYMLRKIRKSEVKIADSTFWFLFGLSLVLLAVFPGIAYFFAGLMNVESPVNFVYLYVIFVLLIREFITTVELSQTRSKLATLTQEIALRRAEEDAALQPGAACAPREGDGAAAARDEAAEGEPCSR